MDSVTLIDGSLRDDATRIARRVIERGADRRLSNPALKFLFAEAARKLAAEPAGEGPYPAKLREPVFQLLVDTIQRVLPTDGVELAFPALNEELEKTAFAAPAPPRKVFRLVDADAVPLSGVTMEVVHGAGAVALRTSDARGDVDVTDLPGSRLKVHAPAGTSIRHDGQLRPERVIRVEEGKAGAARRRDADLRWSEPGYLTGPSAGSPLAELRLGATDEAGAEAWSLQPNVYAGWVTNLQHDLRTLGFYDCPTDGHYGLQTARAVQAFQDEAARCTHRIGRITYHGPLDGVASRATREEIARWLEERSARHHGPLGTGRMTRIIRKVVRVLESDADPYAWIGSHDEGGTIFGVGKFIQRRGDLGDLLSRWFFASTSLFDQVFGPKGRRLLLELTNDESSVRMRTDVGRLWRRQLEAAAKIPIWRDEQDALTRSRAFEPLLDVARAHGIVHERGLAVLYRTNLRAGFDDMEQVAAAIGSRPVGMTPERHHREAPLRIRRAVATLAGEMPVLMDEIARLCSTPSVFDDCEELRWW